MKDAGGLKLKVNHLTNRFFHSVLVSLSWLIDPNTHVYHLDKRVCFFLFCVTKTHEEFSGQIKSHRVALIIPGSTYYETNRANSSNYTEEPPGLHVCKVNTRSKTSATPFFITHLILSRASIKLWISLLGPAVFSL